MVNERDLVVAGRLAALNRGLEEDRVAAGDVTPARRSGGGRQEKKSKRGNYLEIAFSTRISVASSMSARAMMAPYAAETLQKVIRPAFGLL